MTDNELFTTGNITTVIKWISMTLAGWLIGTLTAQGLNLPVDTTALSQVIAAIIFLILGYIDSKYPNTFAFLGNAKLPVDPTEPVLNDEYECDNGEC